MTDPDFSTFPQPSSNDSTSISNALTAVREACDEVSAHEAYDALLWALGNNHSGTFYPVVLAVLPQFEEILSAGNIWAQRAVLESLIDLGGTFVPEPGHAHYLGVSVRAGLRTFLAALRPEILRLAQHTDVRAESARELIELIDDLPA